MLNSRLTNFLSKNLVGETVVCKYYDLVCYGEIKLVTEILSYLLIILFLILSIKFLLLLIDNFIEERDLLLRITYLSTIYVSIRVLLCLFPYN